MYKKQNIFLKKKILIYGMGKSGLSTYNFLKKKSEVYVFDDKKINISNQINKKKILNFKQLKSKIFDRIVLSPGIDINKCKLSKFLKKNYIKIYTDLDIFCNFYSNKDYNNWY